jgi:hypothetical protein
MSFLDRFRSPKDNPNTFKSAEKFRNHLDTLFGKEPLIFSEESKIKGLPGVTIFVYKDFPSNGFITGITYGLSLASHPDWADSRPELCICIKSNSMDWITSMGYIVNNMRGKHSFMYGQTINFGQPVSNESEMDAFLVFAPGIFQHEEDYTKIDVGQHYTIAIAGLYPMYSSEFQIIRQIGLAGLWKHPDFDMFSVKRKNILLNTQTK